MTVDIKPDKLPLQLFNENLGECTAFIRIKIDTAIFLILVLIRRSTLSVGSERLFRP